MTGKKTTKSKEPATIAANDREDPQDAAKRENPRGTLRCVGGSQSDEWNMQLVVQTVETLSANGADASRRMAQLRAAVSGLAGIGPKDELEGIMAAQLVVAHDAAMDCYHHAKDPWNFAARRGYLNMANKLARTSATLLGALDKHRGEGQQKVRVEHVHVHDGGQAVVGSIERPGGGGDRKI